LKTQLDPYSQTLQIEQRFYAEIEWTVQQLANGNILGLGCGAGRFSEVFLRTTTGTLYSIDFSSPEILAQKNNSQYLPRYYMT
jgi:hypothetical protein